MCTVKCCQSRRQFSLNKRTYFDFRSFGKITRNKARVSSGLAEYQRHLLSERQTHTMRWCFRLTLYHSQLSSPTSSTLVLMDFKDTYCGETRCQTHYLLSLQYFPYCTLFDFRPIGRVKNPPDPKI